MNLAIISCYFNPSNLPYLRENHNRFIEGLGSNVDYSLCVVLDYDGDKHSLNLPSAIRVHGTLEDNGLWQKEALLNLGIQEISKLNEIDTIAWVDSDIVFPSEDWIYSLEKSLEKYDIVQLFESCQYLNECGEVEKERSGIVKVRKRTKDGCFGMAWAAKLSSVKQLYDPVVTGSGDAWMAEAWFGLGHIRRKLASEELFSDYISWVEAQPKVKVGYLRQSIKHLFHGNLQGRNYGERLRMMKRHKFNPKTDLVREPNGILGWSHVNLPLEAEVKKWMGCLYGTN